MINHHNDIFTVGKNASVLYEIKTSPSYLIKFDLISIKFQMMM